MTKTQSRRAPSKAKEPKVSRQHKPEGMTLEEWQTLLRRQFGRSLEYKVRNLGDHPAYSDFLVANPLTGSTYRVCIRGTDNGDNFCSCPDFATNTLGTCKHVEFVLARLERNRTAKNALKAGYHPEAGEVVLRYGAQREVCFVPPADVKQEYARLVARYFDSAGRLRAETLGRFDDFLASAAKIDPDLKVAPDVPAYLAEVRDVQTRTSRVNEAFPKGIRSPAFKNLLSVPLYDYQCEGVLFATRAGRCLIGDEMGLGKTAQALGAAEAMARVLGVERVLIVCPTSLKHQWKGEIARFTKRPARVIEGDRATRAEGFADPGPFFKITNYDTIHYDLAPIAAWSPDLVILDEAQRIKNWSTRVARSVKAIRSPYAVVLTGTPLENRLEELVSIVQFVDPHRLGPTFQLLHAH